MQTIGFNSSFAFFLLAMGFLCFLYMILALRTNVVFFLIFLTLVVAFTCLAGAYWEMSNQIGSGVMTNLPTRLITVGGAFAFVTCVCGWWIFFAIMLAALDFPFQLPGKFYSFSLHPWPLLGSAFAQKELSERF
jgi:uncharacterized protein